MKKSSRAILLISLTTLIILIENIALSASLKTAPAFALWSADKKLYRLSDLLRTKELLIISFFATYCQACQKELDYFNSNLPVNEATLIILISTDKDSDALNRFIIEKKLKSLVLSDRYGLTAKKFGLEEEGVIKIPATFIINKKGEIIETLKDPVDFYKKLGNYLKAHNL